MSDYGSIREQWRMLQAVIPLFYSASLLPISDGVDDDVSGASDDVERIHLQHAVTALRTDLKLTRLRQSRIDIDNDDLKAHRESWDFRCCLGETFRALETLIDEEFPLMPKRWIYTMEASRLGCPQLISLREALREHEFKHRLPHDSLHWINRVLGNSRFNMHSPFQRIGSSWRMQYTLDSVQELSQYISFPRDSEGLRELREVFSRFQFQMEDMMTLSIPRYTPEAKMNSFTAKDAQLIAHVDGFASACTSLFTQIADNITCGESHVARVHLSGFKKDQLKLDIQTSHSPGTVSAVFTRGRPVTLHVSFDRNAMWIQNTGGRTESLSSPGDQEDLDYHLSHLKSFQCMHRRLVSVLLAGLMFQLSGTPWIEPYLDPERIFLPMPIEGDLKQWCPRIRCDLEVRQATPSQSDNIAALGVILMELEGVEKSKWLPDRDEDWVSGQLSNHFRFFRWLEEKIPWKSSVTEDCRQIARACLEFDGLVDDLEHPKIIGQRKSLAVFYRYILEPLSAHATSGFGDLKPIVDGMFGRGRHFVPSTSTNLATTKSLILFDDDMSAANENQKVASNDFREKLMSFFKYIREIGQPEPLWDNKLPRIRIAVLDSGVDKRDSEIYQAIKCGQINRDKSKTFIQERGGTEDSWQRDTYGHGTKVTQLLLETAPAAEIFVCKISTGKVINQENMSGIAEAIKWASSECNAHIISMSFGYRDYDDLIEKELEKAISSGKLIIAAASNDGGMKGRSRPASREGVLCIHATDGLGNKGLMNPSPLETSDNFATLGVAVRFHTNEGEMWKSGTSFATPIAVGFAAAVLEFARHREASGHPIDRGDLLSKKRGMEAIFRKMANKRDGYDFIQPLQIWGERQCEHKKTCRCWREEGDEDEIAKVIQDALRLL